MQNVHDAGFCIGVAPAKSPATHHPNTSNFSLIPAANPVLVKYPTLWKSLQATDSKQEEKCLAVFQSKYSSLVFFNCRRNCSHAVAKPEVATMSGNLPAASPAPPRRRAF
jgi:hypothetical protein